MYLTRPSLEDTVETKSYLISGREKKVEQEPAILSVRKQAHICEAEMEEPLEQTVLCFSMLSRGNYASKVIDSTERYI